MKSIYMNVGNKICEFQNAFPALTSNPVYSLTLLNAEHGTVTADTITGHEGDTVNLTVSYDEYYRFSGYEVTGGIIVDNSFTFGNSDVTVQPYFKQNIVELSGTFNMGTVPSLGRNRLTFSAFPQITSGDNYENNILSSVKTSIYTILSAVSDSYTAGWTGTNTAFNGFVENSIDPAFTWCYKNKIISDYSMTAVSGEHSYFNLCSETSGNVIDTGVLSDSGKGEGTTYTAYYTTSGTTATNLPDVFVNGWASAGRYPDNVSLADTNIENRWYASAIAP